jgi:hypothetical protein
VSAVKAVTPGGLRECWTRIGAGFYADAQRSWVDIERLIIQTAEHCRHDERLFVMAASWLSLFHLFVDARRMGRLLLDTSSETKAIVGALLSLARSQTGSGSSPLDSVVASLKPLQPMSFLFLSTSEFPAILNRTRQRAIPLFARWGFWHDDDKLKLNALNTKEWVLRHCPEIRIRAFLGPGLDAEIVCLLAGGTKTTKDLAEASGATYAAVFSATSRLLGLRLLNRDAGKSWSLSAESRRLIAGK